MNGLRDLWGTRFVHYMNEFQKYMRYVFTGHLAIVLLFTIGAGGYAYSEWLKQVPSDFPAALLAALLISAAVTYSSPVTLLKPADTVFFLPLETKLGEYMDRALRWTTFSQLPLPFLLFIVAVPLLSATAVSSTLALVLTVVFIIALKWIFVETEYNFRHAYEGRSLWKDRGIRFVLAAGLLYTVLTGKYLLTVVFAVVIVFHQMKCRQAKNQTPFPYEHFISLEQNRMMRFYRFANYFTDVPHLKGSVSRRAWLGFLMPPPKFDSAEAQTFLVRRTFLRTDDTFWLWVRLTAISVVGAFLIPFPIVVFIFAGALAFASAIQLIYALQSGDEFRMDMLFPVSRDARPAAIRKTVRTVQWIQAAAVTLAACFLYGFASTPFLVGAVVLIISEATIRLAKEKED